MQIDSETFLLHPGEHFQDAITGEKRFPVTVLQMDFTNESVTTLVAGKIHTNSLTASIRPATDTSWIHLQSAAFKDAMNLYGELSGRVILLHPEVNRAPVSCQINFTNPAPNKAEITAGFAEWLKVRNASVINDGDTFLQIIPTPMVSTATIGSKDLPAENKSPGMVNFENIPLNQIINIYGQLLGRRRADMEVFQGTIPYFRTSQPLSKPQALYALKTLLAWQGVQIILNDDNTFSAANGQSTGAK